VHRQSPGLPFSVQRPYEPPLRATFKYVEYLLYFYVLLDMKSILNCNILGSVESLNRLLNGYIAVAFGTSFSVDASLG
jgi:hypothetical protein